MNPRSVIYVILSILIFGNGCMDNATEKQKTNPRMDLEQEKTSILKVLNDETKAAFNRDYAGWKEKWIQKSYVTKTYMNFADNSMSETLGWKEIDDFVRTYIEEHPEPAPLPKLVDSIDVRIYGNGAWVMYEQVDPKLGTKRETRLMEKENGQWKIAGMQTIIYGFKDAE